MATTSMAADIRLLVFCSGPVVPASAEFYGNTFIGRVIFIEQRPSGRLAIFHSLTPHFLQNCIYL